MFFSLPANATADAAHVPEVSETTIAAWRTALGLLQDGNVGVGVFPKANDGNARQDLGQRDVESALSEPMANPSSVALTACKHCMPPGLPGYFSCAGLEDSSRGV